MRTLLEVPIATTKRKAKCINPDTDEASKNSMPKSIGIKFTVYADYL